MTAGVRLRAWEFHPLADLFPLMEGDEFEALVADIKTHGLRESIVTYQGKILDGRNRYRACHAARMQPYTEQGDGWIDDTAAYVISMNIRRRHLTGEQKRELIEKLLKASPERSNNALAKVVKVDDKTVGAVRADLERRSEIPNVTTRTDTKGRKQPAKKKRPTVEDFKREIAAKKAAVAPAPQAKTVRDAIAPDEELALLREFARLFVSERVRVSYDPKDRDEWRALFSRVKAVLGGAP
jgi:hypothetical protein